MKAVTSLLLLGLSLLPQLLWAQEWVDGTIRRIDTSGQKMTIKHEEIKELLMPPMTMVFRLKDPMWTVQFKVGDPIRFRVVDLGNGRLQVIELERKD
jgi:Cu(I)/Ag(I) efflux system protein CusF